MKKRVIVFSLLSCLCLSLCACGSKATKDVVIDTSKTSEIAEEVFEEVVEEAKEEGLLDGVMTVEEQDKSDEWGVNSGSCEDAYKFLKDDHTVDYAALESTGEVGNYDYSGRFAYPEVVEGKYLKNIELQYRSDTSESLGFSDNGEYCGTINIYLGHDKYDFRVSQIGVEPLEGCAPIESFGSMNIDGENVEVAVVNNLQDSMPYTVYSVTKGAFTVEIQRSRNDAMFTQDELAGILDEIVLK